MEVELDGRLLIARFSQAQRVLSWAPHHGGLRETRAVVWRHATNAELPVEVDAHALLRDALAVAGLEGAVGMLTGRDLSTFDDVTLREGALWARCVATVGLANALAVGDPPGPLSGPGTINLLIAVSCPLSDEALVELSSLASEARTAAVLERAFPSRRSGKPSTGTGTDCIVAAAPVGESPETYLERYAGKHTLLGALAGGAVREACARGVARWLDEQ
jgi:adenosylcobinamide amidohydrolase